MPIICSNNSFQHNLDQSFSITKDRDLRDFWLNSDGTVTPKASWLGRMVRWILNYLFNKTSSDIWQTFTRAQADFEKSRKALSSPDSWTNGIDLKNHQIVLEKGKRLIFVIEFLLSRKRSFDRLKSKDPSTQLSLESIKHYYKTQLKNEFSITSNLMPKQSLVTINYAKAAITGLYKAHQKQLETLTKSLETLVLPSLKEESISKKAPVITPKITQKKNPKEYKALLLEELVVCYDSRSPSNKDLSLATELLTICQTGNFLSNFSKVLQDKKISLPNKPFLTSFAKPPKTIKEFHELIEHLSSFVAGNLKGALGNIPQKKLDKLCNHVFKETLKKSISPQLFNLLEKIIENRINFARLIEKTIQRDPEVFGVNAKIHNQFYDQIECFLKNILFEIKSNPGLSNEKIKSAFQELSIAGGLCGARWMEESKKQYISLQLKNQTLLEHSILRDLQSLKEDLLFEIFQKQHQDYHILDAIRKELGEELGLDDSIVNLDIFTPELPKKQINLIKRLFKDAYVPKRIVRGLKDRINVSLQEAFNPDLFIFLANRVETKFQNVEDSPQYVMDRFMKSDLKLVNKDGVIFLLKEMGILEG